MFVECHTAKGEVLTVNLALIVCVCKKGSTLVFADGLTQDVTEPYAEIVDKLQAVCPFGHTEV